MSRPRSKHPTKTENPTRPNPRRPLPGGSLGIAWLILFVGVGLLTSQTQAAPPASEVNDATSKGDKETTPFQFLLKVVGPDGTAVPNARIEIRTKPIPTTDQIERGTYLRAGSYGTFAEADDTGRLAVTLPSTPERFNLSIQQPGYGPYWAGWDSHAHPETIPDQFTADLEAGWSIGGIVVSAWGLPVAGAEVSPSVSFKKRPGDTEHLGVGTRIVTDAEGRWRFDHVPASKSDVHIAINHPDYRPLRRTLPRDRFAIQLEEAPRAPIELDSGLTIHGTVTDQSGAPVAGALVRTRFLNDVRETKSDAQGTYRLYGCEPRMAQVVVTAEGRAIDMREVRVDAEMAAVDFVMQPAGHIRVRVVDEQGRGIPKARIFFQRWRDAHAYFPFDLVNQYADENGVWEWDQAPHDTFVADICRPGGMQLTDQPLTARAEEYVFKPPRALVVSGKVIDANSKQPIERFRVIPGLRNRDPRIGMNWIQQDSYQASEGKYRIEFDRTEPAHLVRIEADGYQVAISRDIKNHEGEVAYDFELLPAVDIAATILTSSGAPAAEAKIAFGVAGSQISINNGEIDDGSTYATRLNADAEGRFSIPARNESFQLVITHPAGFAYLKSAEGPIPERIELTPWARVEGTFRVGPRLAPNVALVLNANAIHSYGDDVPNIFTHYKVTTGEHGRFFFERVFPGTGHIGREIMLVVNQGATEVTSSVKISAEYVSGETTRIELGGTGRPVIGKLAPPAARSEPVVWNFALVNAEIALAPPPAPPVPAEVQNDAEKQQLWWRTWQTTRDGQAWLAATVLFDQRQRKAPYIAATVDRDGSFRIDDVPPGSYKLSVRFSEHAAGSVTNYRFTVPPTADGEEPEPVRLGVLRLEE